MAIDGSEVNVINEALNRLGQIRITAGQISSPDNKVSRLVADSYERHRNAALRDHPWNFAIYRRELSKNVTAPVYGFNYAYDLPDGSPDPYCLRVLQLNDQVVWDYSTAGWSLVDDMRRRWKVEQRQILVDIDEPLGVRYIGVPATVDATAWDDLFFDALAAKCAFFWCENLTSSDSLKERQGNEFERILREARSIDGQEGIHDALETTDWLIHRLS